MIYIDISLDENASDLDFEESLDKNHATPTLHNESEKSPISKPGLSFVFDFNENTSLFYCSSISGIDKVALGDHAAMAIDFKGEG